MGEEEGPEGDDNFGPKAAVFLIGLTALIMVPRWVYKAARPHKAPALQQGFGGQPGEEAPGPSDAPYRPSPNAHIKLLGSRVTLNASDAEAIEAYRSNR